MVAPAAGADHFPIIDGAPASGGPAAAGGASGALALVSRTFAPLTAEVDLPLLMGWKEAMQARGLQQRHHPFGGRVTRQAPERFRPGAELMRRELERHARPER